MRILIAVLGFLTMLPFPALAQSVQPHYRGQGYAYFGLGTGTGNAYNTGVEQMGFGEEGFLHKGWGFGGEAGYASWGKGVLQKAWIGSADPSYHFGRHARRRGFDPFVLGGFSIFGPTQKGNGRGEPAANVGGGLNLWLGTHTALRFEARDYFNSGDYIPGHQYLSLRVGVTFR